LIDIWIDNAREQSANMYPFIYFFWPHISGLLILCWPFGQYVLCLLFYVIACTSMSLLVDELNK